MKKKVKKVKKYRCIQRVHKRYYLALPLTIRETLSLFKIYMN